MTPSPGHLTGRNHPIDWSQAYVRPFDFSVIAVTYSEGEAAARAIRAFSSEVDPVRVKKTRQHKNLEPRSDSIGTEKALAVHRGVIAEPRKSQHQQP